MVKSSPASEMSHLTATLPANGNGGLVALNGGLNNNALHENKLNNLNNLNGDVNMNDKEMIEEEEETPEVDINISNVVCHFSTRCHLNLRTVATNGANVEYKREQGVVLMKLRHPKVTASIWSSGKIIVTGSTSEDEAKVAARKVARVLQKMSFKVKFTAFRVVNVLGSVILPFGIRIAQFTEENRRICSYEPEIHPGATYRYSEAGATLKIFQTGAITITAPSVSAVQSAVEHIYPLVFNFKKDKPPQHLPVRKRVLTDNNENNKLKGAHKSKKRRKYEDHSDEDDFINDEEILDEEMSNDEDF